MKPCIVIKQIQFEHQILFTGRGDEGRCHLCQETVQSRKAYELQLATERQWRATRFPEGAEL